MKPNLKNIKGLTYPMDDKAIPQMEYIHQFLHHLPYYALLLDSNRKIVASNKTVLNDNALNDVRELFDKGPGDIFQCENAEEAGCGNSPNCKFCGIYKTLAECHERDALITNSCKIMVKRDSFIKAFEFMVRCSPIIFPGAKFFLMTLTDVSSDSRKRSLERIFFS
ncbi:MAG: hypothetical protein HC831_10425 [Chloroflexia bacterium]|nr:hypothetical protein [Chloroflexia bacterium]